MGRASTIIFSSIFMYSHYFFFYIISLICLPLFDIEPFYSMINNPDSDLNFIFKNSSKSSNFLDINIRIVENSLVFDIQYKPTNSFNHLTHKSCHPPHTKNNLSLSLAKRIVSIVANNRENRLK